MTSRSIHVPDRNGHLEDVVLGWDYLEGYPCNEPYFGANVGRYANRIGDATLATDGQSFQLDANQALNRLHDRVKGFHKVLWRSEIVLAEDSEKLKFAYLSGSGEEGYPGDLHVEFV